VGPISFRGRQGEPSEAALVGAAQRGEPEAAAGIVREYWADAYCVAYLLSRDHGAAEEISQDALLSAIRAIDSFEADRPFRPWLQRITANAAYDWLRRQKRRPTLVELDDLDGPEESDADTIAAVALPSELLSALLWLDVEHRTAVVFRYVLDYEPTEIAEIVGVPAATVRTRIRRGLDRMRHHLEGEKGAREHEQAR
jgi:RNA polymerase sigma-70 factor (ECF subfamily)